MAMDMFGAAMGGAAKSMGGGATRGAMGMGGGNGGSFAQKQMMKSNPVMQGGGMGARLGMAQQRPQMASTFGMQGPNKMRPTAGMLFGNMMKPGMGPGIGPRAQGQMGGIAQGMGQAIAPWMQQRKPMPDMGGTGPYMPEGGGGIAQPQVQGPNGESPMQQQGRMGGLAEMFRKMQMQQQQQPQGRGYNTGIAGGMMGRGIAPQLSMMPQQMQQQQQPNPYGAGYGEEEAQY